MCRCMYVCVCVYACSKEKYVCVYVHIVCGWYGICEKGEGGWCVFVSVLLLRILCVCVCVSVGERERDRERENVLHEGRSVREAY